MVYVTSDGRILQSKPWGLQRLLGLLWGFLNFFILFFKSLVGLNANSGASSRSGGPGGPGGGPRRGPRTLGDYKTADDCSMPGGG